MLNVPPEATDRTDEGPKYGKYFQVNPLRSSLTEE